MNYELKVIILIFDIKENERTYNRQLIYQQIYIMNVKTKYIPSYIFGNEGKIFKERKLPKLNEFPDNLRCSNINGAMHKLLVRKCLAGAKSVR